MVWSCKTQQPDRVPLTSSDPFNNQAYADFTPLWPCDKPGAPSTSYCCNSPNRNCCEIATFQLGTTGSAFKGGMDLLLAEIANSSSVPATVTVTTTAVSAAQTGNSTAAAQPKAAPVSSTSNLGPAIGLGIGLPFGLLALGILSFLFWREQKRNHSVSGARIKMLEMDSGHKSYAQESHQHADYPTKGPPPAPPEVQRFNEGTWSSQTASLPSRSVVVQKSPGFVNGQTDIHELI